MRLTSVGGSDLVLRVTGYQFPDSDDPAQRYSWHVVEGLGADRGRQWRFRYSALSCDESPLLSGWLRLLAAQPADLAEGETPDLAPLRFSEPNLALRAGAVNGASVEVRVELDCEFHPAHPGGVAGDPYLLDLTVTHDQLREAAAEWDADIRAYPDAAEADRLALKDDGTITWQQRS